MKNLKLLLVAMTLVLLCLPASAQNKNVFKTNLLSPLARTGSFFYERGLNENSTAQFGFFYTGISFEETIFRGFGITPEYRYYLSDKKPAPHGFFLAPYLRYQSFNLSIENEVGKATLSTIGGGLLVGAQTVLKDVISIEAFLGPNYSAGSIKVDSGSEDRFSTGILGGGFGLRFGVTLGIVF